MLLGLTAANVVTATLFYFGVCCSAQRLQIKHLLKADVQISQTTLHTFSSGTAVYRKKNNGQGTNLESIVSCHDEHNGFAWVPQRDVIELLSMQQFQRMSWQDSLVSNHFYKLLGDQDSGPGAEKLT